MIQRDKVAAMKEELTSILQGLYILEVNMMNLYSASLFCLKGKIKIQEGYSSLQKL